MVKLEQLKKYIPLFSPDTPKAREVYAVTTGKYVGEMLTLCETVGDTYCFITIPKLEIRVVPIDKFKLGIESKIVEFVQRLPPAVYKILYKQYIWKKNDMNKGNVEDADK